MGGQNRAILNEGFNIVPTTETVICRVRPAQPADGDAMAFLAEQLGYPCTGAEVRKRLDEMKDPTEYGTFVAARS